MMPMEQVAATLAGGLEQVQAKLTSWLSAGAGGSLSSHGSLHNQTPEQERPYLRLCKKCGGKGQLSYLDKYQEKTYGACTNCSNAAGPYALGVSVKCRCQKPAVAYTFVFGSHVRQFKHWKQEEDLRALHKFQRQLGKGGTAVLIMCDVCGARYLAKDGAGERRKISTDKELNEEDKEYNRHIAMTLIANGICCEIDPPPGTSLPQRPSLTVSEPELAGPLNSNPLSIDAQQGITIKEAIVLDEQPPADMASSAFMVGTEVLQPSPPETPRASCVTAEDAHLRHPQPPAGPVPAPPTTKRSSSTPRAAGVTAAFAAMSGSGGIEIGQVPSRASLRSLDSPMSSVRMRTNSLFDPRGQETVPEEALMVTKPAPPLVAQQVTPTPSSPRPVAADPLPASPKSPRSTPQQPLLHLRPLASARVPVSPISITDHQQEPGAR